ncbi:unnamed protein product, partial [Hapterophycus canaliculatus]
CGATYTHVESRPGNGGSGTSGMLHHLLKKHPLIHAEIMRASPAAKARRTEGNEMGGSGGGGSGSGDGDGGGGGGGKAPSPVDFSASPGTALDRLRAGGLGSDEAPPIPYTPRLSITAEETLAHDRRLVLMCALQTLDPTSLDSSLGFRLFLDGLSPGYSAARRRAPASNPAAVANAILRDLCTGVRQEIAAALKSQSDSCRRLGWTGPFVGLQVDSTGMSGGAGAWAGGEEDGGGDEVCTASVSFVPQGFDGLVRLAIGARFFRGRQASDAKKAWIRELTSDLFASMCGQSEPKDVYLAATLGCCSGGGGDGGGSFRRALEDMGIPVLMCSSHRLHSAVAWSLGGSGSFGSGGGSGDADSNGADNSASSSNGLKCANAKMRDVVRRAVSMVEIFQHWRPRDGASSAGPAAAALETVRSEVEELAVALTRTRGANARRSHALFERLLGLAGPLTAYFRGNPSSLSLHPSEWQAIREAASILEPALEVVAKVHAEKEPGEGEGGRAAAEPPGGAGNHQAGSAYSNGDGVVGAASRAAAAAGKRKKSAPGIFLAESIELHANLHCSFIYPLQDIRTGNSGSEMETGAGVGGDGGAAADGAFCSKRVGDLTPEAQALLEAVAEAMEDNGLGRAREDTEAVAMLLDPRFKQCCASTCVDGGNELKLRARSAVTSQLMKFKGPAEAGGDAGGRQSGGGRSGGGRGAAQRQEAGGAMAVSRLDKMRQAQKMEAEAAAAGGDGSASSPGGTAG